MPLDDETASIINEAAKPDAEASTLKEVTQSPDKVKGKRGRPKKSGGSVAAKSQADITDYNDSAVAINTLLFTSVSLFCGTPDAWPEDDKAKIMDSALARYMSVKQTEVKPEFVLLAVYAQYIHSVAQKDSVKENLKKRFGGIGGKISAKFSGVKNLVSKFKKSKGQ